MLSEANGFWDIVLRYIDIASLISKLSVAGSRGGKKFYILDENNFVMYYQHFDKFVLRIIKNIKISLLCSQSIVEDIILASGR